MFDIFVAYLPKDNEVIFLTHSFNEFSIATWK